MITIPKSMCRRNPSITRKLVDISYIKQVNPWGLSNRYEVKLHGSATSRHIAYKKKILFVGTYLECLEYCYKNGFKIWSF